MPPCITPDPSSFLCQKLSTGGQNHETLPNGFQEELKANKHGRNGMWNSPVILTRKSLLMNTSLPISVFFVIYSLFLHPLLSRKWWRRGLAKWLIVSEQRRSSSLWSTQGPAQISNSFRKCLLLPSKYSSLPDSEPSASELPAAPSSASSKVPGVFTVNKESHQSCYIFSTSM